MGQRLQYACCIEVIDVVIAEIRTKNNFMYIVIQ